MGVRTDYLGRDTFTWWVGEVEEIRDPAELGRIKVRILGWYTGNREGPVSYTHLTLPTKA